MWCGFPEWLRRLIRVLAVFLLINVLFLLFDLLPVVVVPPVLFLVALGLVKLGDRESATHVARWVLLSFLLSLGMIGLYGLNQYVRRNSMEPVALWVVSVALFIAIWLFDVIVSKQRPTE